MENCNTPCNTNPCDNYCPSQEDLCNFEYFKPYIQKMIDQSQPDLSVINALIDGIDDYECNEGKLYQCKDIVLYKGGFYESLKNENDRHPHDANAWKSHGTLKDIFAALSSFDGKVMLGVELHPDCDSSTNCKAFFNKCEITAVMVDSGEVDSCDNPVMVPMFYKSLVDKNMDSIEDGLNSTPPTWAGPYTEEQLIAGGGLCPDLVCETMQLIDETTC